MVRAISTSGQIATASITVNVNNSRKAGNRT
jgi:hypothetical protein